MNNSSNQRRVNSIAYFLTSFNAVVIGLLIFLAYRYFEVVTLFHRYLPIDDRFRLFAAILISIIVVFILTLFSAHLEKFRLSGNDSGNWIKLLLFVFTLLINAYFWEPWINPSEHRIAATIFKSSLVLFFALFDFSFNHLFNELWKSEQIKNLLQLDLAELQRTKANLERDISKAQATLIKTVQMSDPRFCPHCAQEFENINQRNAHLRTCKIRKIDHHELSRN